MSLPSALFITVIYAAFQSKMNFLKSVNITDIFLNLFISRKHCILSNRKRDPYLKIRSIDRAWKLNHLCAKIMKLVGASPCEFGLLFTITEVNMKYRNMNPILSRN